MADIEHYLGAALEHLGRITIIVAPLDEHDAVYDRQTGILYVDSDADKPAAIAAVLRDLIDGPAERYLVSLAGGDQVTACGFIPAQASTDPSPSPLLRLVREA